MKVKSKTIEGKPKVKLALTLTKEELNLLGGLVDFPTHDAQPEPIESFLETLMDAISEAGGETWASRSGYVNSTTV